ncbi:hypothetical protein G7Y89_g13839 [Cudoniella acicularis]|uniref:Transaldolase n=1 Tax=Cudoniella acicularis TaxID=354080 RepID=A0A8H4R7S5_9HELO|nr:hypothetical protein G7Y89_g13839 [Cudoniella acicularis]
MGVEGRKAPPLPAPTETDTTTGSSEIGSRVTEKSNYTLPEDGSPVTISTRRKKGDKDSHGNLSSNKSQTSLLIEYFEGGKDGKAESRRPSVRVKVTPSSKSRSRSTNDHIQITERKGTRKPSYTKRIQLSPSKSIEGDGDDNNSLRSYRSATEESNVTSRGGGPIEVEIMPRRHGSPLIPSEGSKFAQQNTSDISSMPANSFLDGKSTQSSERKRSRSLSRGEALAAGAAAGVVAGVAADKLKTPSRRRSRSLSRERIVAQKAVEKVRGENSERRRKHRSRSRSVSGELEGVKSPRRRSSRSHHEDSLLSGADSSVLNSHLSGKSGDAYSFRSGTSKSSINNPKLLETVEDAIRRLILPELTALKREQSKHTSRDRDRRGSVTSGSAISRDSREDGSSTRRLSERGSGTDLSSKPKVTLNDSEVLSGNSVKGRKDRNLDRVRTEDSPRGFERGSSEETAIQDGERVSKKRSSDRNRGLEAAAIGAGMGALTAAALHKHQSQDSIDSEKKERRRRRTKSRSRGESLAESLEEEQEHETLPPMPLMMSDVNASEVTRASILSAESDRPHSASQEHRVTPVHEVSRGIASPRGVASPSSLTPTRTPTRTPVALQQGLGTQHSNYSRGNLSLHSQHSEQQLRNQEYELDEQGRKVPMQGSPEEEEYEDSYVEEERTQPSNHNKAGLAAIAAGAAVAAAAYHHADDDHEDPELLEDEQPSYYQNTQEVPPPLRYVPYGHERRGLSPIQSVSGYTEGDPEPQQRSSRLTQSTGSYSSLNKSVQHKSPGRSLKSVDSLANRHDFPEVRQGGLTDSELTQDDRVATGQNVRGVAQNAEYVHTPIAVESAVASLVNASDLTGVSGYSGNNGKFGRRDSEASFDEGSERHFTSRGNSPTKRGTQRDMEYDGSDRGASSQRNSPTKYPEYELDDAGRKITMPKYGKTHTTEKAALAGIAAAAATAVMRGRNKKVEMDETSYEDPQEIIGAPLQKSFKERALEGQGQIPSPRHSIDAPLSEAASHEPPQMTASGLPDLNNPMPEIGEYYDDASDVTTNPSIIKGPIGGMQKGSRDHWPGHTTPPQPNLDTDMASRSQKSDANLKAAEAALVGAGALATLANHSRQTSRDHDEEWQRTSGERKRDTLVTNPYEGTSPIAALGGPLDPNLLPHSGFDGNSHNYNSPKMGYQTGSPLLKDEGYISSAPNARSPGAATPEPRQKGVNFMDEELGGADGLGGDPFYSPKHARHLSGMSHGMGSPIYDSATGNGIDRIQSKDIVALMDHLTVRDAQRSARDTEILVTLVRAAAEMRNSFEDMKRLLADTEDVVITEVQGNTEKSVQKIINGPRPLPPSAARSLRQGSQDEMFDDIPNKKRNVFRRALKGLSMRSSNDLGKIEEMLVQLLGEVEGLKAAQGLKGGSSQHAESFSDLHQEGNYEHDGGYEPEGNAGTSTASHGSQSGHLSLPLSRGPSAARGFDGRKFSDHRISTVPEGDEEEQDAPLSHHSQRSRHAVSPQVMPAQLIPPQIHQEPHDQIIRNNFENPERLQTPTREFTRGGSAPLGTPPQQQVTQASLSNENTPRTDKSKKHKSSSSSGWIPKVSRWSETTASTVLRGFRSSGRSSSKKGDEQFVEPPSRSGSDLGHYPEHDPYGEDKLHTGFSQEQIQQPYEEPEPSMLPPEDPKYKAHRNSLNLQHPQPRPGPTVRYQTALESQAVNFDQPMSPKSMDWGSSTSINRLPGQQTNRYSTGTNNTGGTGGENLSPISDGSYSNGSASNQAPARPPKEPLGPERQPKIRSGKLQKPSPLSREHLQADDERPQSPGYEPGGSPRSAARKLSGAMSGIPTRKPTGPRSMASPSRSGEITRDEGTVIRRNKNRDTFGTIASNNSGESETF